VAIDFTPPRVLEGRYDRVEHLGGGAFGSVWAYRDRVLDRTVAIKFFVSHGAVHLPPIEEAQRVARIEHPNVVNVFDVLAVPGGGIAMVMQRVVGRSAQQLDRPVEPRQALIWAEQLAGGLHSIHAANLAHCDLHDGNVMIRGDSGAGQPVIIDMGISVGLKSKGPSAGRPEFCAPERFGGKADATTDFYSLGVLLWQFATGLQIADRVRGNDPHIRHRGAQHIVSNWGIDRGDGLGRLIAKLVALDPRDRPDRDGIRALAARAAQELGGAATEPIGGPGVRAGRPAAALVEAARAEQLEPLLKAGVVADVDGERVAVVLVSDPRSFRAVAPRLATRLGARVVVCRASTTLPVLVDEYLTALRPGRHYPKLRAVVDEDTLYVGVVGGAVPAGLEQDLRPLAAALGRTTTSVHRR
jgi:hypothetical protein